VLGVFGLEGVGSGKLRVNESESVKKVEVVWIRVC